MPAYVIVIRDRITDSAELDQYGRKARQITGDFGITPLAFYGENETWEGEPADAAVILQFPSMERARAWYNSPEYQDALQHRLRGADCRVILVDGLPSPPK